MSSKEDLRRRIHELEEENRRLRAGFFHAGDKPTVLVPKSFPPFFDKAQKAVADYFSAASAQPSQGRIEIADQRYVLIRAQSLSIDFLSTIQDLYSDRGEEEALAIGRSFLFDIAHTIGMNDARNFAEKAGVTDPLDRLSSGPVHFAYSGWAMVDIKPASRPSPDQDFLLIYEHPNSFEADSWLQAGRHSSCPVCIMNAGYSSGWCEASYGLELTSVEVYCRAQGDPTCTFVMAPPERISERVQEFFGTELQQRATPTPEIPSYFERKRVEQFLRDSEERYRVLVENAPEAIVLLDQKTGKFTDANDTASALFGLEREALIELSPLDLSPPFQSDGRRSREVFPQHTETAFRGDPVLFEWTFQRPSGEPFPTELRLAALTLDERDLICATVTDITQRRKAEAEKNRLVTALEQAADTILITDQRGAILYVNPAFEKLSGYSQEEVFGQNPSLLKSDRHEPGFYREIWEQLASGQTWEGRTTNLSKDGRYYEEEGTISPVRDTTGQIVNYVAVRRDVTGKTARERRAVQAQKMEALGQLSAGLAHELNTPLQYVGDNLKFLRNAFEDLVSLSKALRTLPTQGEKAAVITHLKTLLEEADLDYLVDEVPTALEQSLNGVHRIAKVVSGIKQLSRADSDKTPVNLIKSIENAIELSRHEWSKTAVIVRDYNPELPVVPAYPYELGQVVLNLIVNAAQAIHKDESPDKKDKLGTIKVTTSRHQSAAQITVEDTGPGIPAELQNRIFDPFFSTKEVGDGTGQGLAISRSIVEDMHGGTLDFESVLGRGTTFTLLLPMDPG